MRRGFSLIEALVGLAILSIILLVLVEGLTWGLRAHAKGEKARQAQALARDVVGRLTTEIGTGVALDTLFSNASHPQDFFSAVVWPDPYQALSATTFTDPLYARTRVTESGVEIDRVQNRVILTRPGVDITNTTFNDRDYSQFVYVEYLVAPPSVNGRGQHQLLRRVYRVANLPSGPPRGNDSTPGTFFRYVAPAFFAISTYDPTDPLAIFANPNTNVALLPPPQRAAQTVVTELPENTDRLSFTVEHARNRETVGVSDPNQLSRFPFYDRSLFTVMVTVSLGRVQSGPSEKFLATRTLSGQARVKSGE